MARFYGWTYNEVADMTPQQILCAFDAAVENANREDTGSIAADGNLHFSTREEWELWKAGRGMNNG